MSNTGKLLESFVQQIERLVLPEGCTISQREKVFNESGVQIAEFDIEITGKIGTTNFKWLIECRDRPSDGPAPGSWIEQLVGRRNRFKFDKVIAVSSTGFADSAVEYARDSGIEIRSVTKADFDQIKPWFQLREMTLVKIEAILKNATLNLREKEAKVNYDALKSILAKSNADSEILLSTETGQHISINKAFSLAVSSIDGLKNNLMDNGDATRIDLLVRYLQDNSHFVVETNCGTLRIDSILFQGELNPVIEKVPILEIQKYENNGNSEVIATKVCFRLDIEGKSQEISFNKIEETGEIHVILGDANSAS